MITETTYDTIVVGGGLAGIATAIRRRKRGDRVLLLEKNNRLGGKMDEKSWQNYRWDKGPSLFTMPQLVDELFELCGKRPKDYFTYVKQDESCRYFFKDGTKFTLYSNTSKRIEALSKQFTLNEIAGVENYVREASELYSDIGNLFIDRPKLSWRDMLKSEVVRQYPRILSRQMMNSLNAFNEQQLSNKKLVQIFNRFATYNGSDPYQTSGLYSMVSHLELNQGTYFPKGGMRTIVDSLEKLALEEGVEIRFDETNISAVAHHDLYKVTTNNGEVFARRLVSAIDHVNFYKYVLGDQKQSQKLAVRERSTSGLIFYWAMNKRFDKIGLHNIFFSSDYVQEFKDLFAQKIIPTDPTIYIHNSSFLQKKDAPEDGQNWFVMINTPAGVDITSVGLEEIKDKILTRLEEHLSVNVAEHIIHEDYWSKTQLEEITGAYKGALYGEAFNSKLASLKRHGNECKKYKNIYFSGGTVHPGGGVPLVLKSAKIVDELIEKNG